MTRKLSYAFKKRFNHLLRKYLLFPYLATMDGEKLHPTYTSLHICANKSTSESDHFPGIPILTTLYIYLARPHLSPIFYPFYSLCLSLSFLSLFVSLLPSIHPFSSHVVKTYRKIGESLKKYYDIWSTHTYGTTMSGSKYTLLYLEVYIPYR